MNNVLVLCLIVAFVSCTNFKSKKDFKYVIKLCKIKPFTCTCNLHVEGYIVSKAFGSTDIYSEYLTDSNSFRIYIGNFDEGNERLVYNCKGDTVFFEKRTNKNLTQGWDTFRVIERKTYLLKDLIKKREFQ